MTMPAEMDGVLLCVLLFLRPGTVGTTYVQSNLGTLTSGDHPQAVVHKVHGLHDVQVQYS